MAGTGVSSRQAAWAPLTLTAAGICLPRGPADTEPHADTEPSASPSSPDVSQDHSRTAVMIGNSPVSMAASTPFRTRNSAPTGLRRILDGGKLHSAECGQS
jgi:hypothetical protein